jgi:hypothetical protein
MVWANGFAGEFSFEEAVRRPKHPAVRYQRRKRTIEERP